jgi:predicted ATPase
MMHRGVAGSGVALLRTALDGLREMPQDIRYQLYLVWYAETLAASGNPAEALTAIDEALRRAERTEERWYLPELLRLRGEFLRATGQPDAAEAEGQFRQAVDWAPARRSVLGTMRSREPRPAIARSG